MDEISYYLQQDSNQRPPYNSVSCKGNGIAKSEIEEQKLKGLCHKIRKA
jgi:hypothetical protein